MYFAMIVFAVALVGIVCLFALKYWENRSARVVASRIRERFDARALQLKDLMIAARIDLDRVPPEAARLSRIVIHKGALGFAAFARMAERHAYRVADLVSYKHRFEKRETSSEFLKKVAEHKIGGEESAELGRSAEHDESTS